MGEPSGFLPSTTFWPLNSGRYFSTASSSVSLPSSTSSISAVPVMGLVCDAIQKSASGFITRWVARSANPTASTASTLSFDATSATAPASSPFSTKGFSASAMGEAAMAACSVARRSGRNRVGFMV